MDICSNFFTAMIPLLNEANGDCYHTLAQSWKFFYQLRVYM